MKVKNKNILPFCKFYIIKIKNNQIQQALPCDMCKKLLLKYGVTKICNISRNTNF